jgi:hypothetical protein
MIRRFVCCALKYWVISPTFFDDTINSDRYCEVTFYPFIGHLSEARSASSYRQQDGGILHTQLIFP